MEPALPSVSSPLASRVSRCGRACAASFALPLLLFGAATAAARQVPAQDGQAPAVGDDPEVAAVPAAATVSAEQRGWEALRAVARSQRGDEPRPAPQSLHGRFHVGVRAEDGSLIKAEVERWYERSPERLRTSRKEEVTGSATTVVFDAGQAWFRDDLSGRLVVYSDAPEIHDVDLEQIGQDLRLTRLLLDAAVVDALLPRLSDVRDVGAESYEDLDGERHAVLLVRASLPDELFGPDPKAPPPAPDDPAPHLELAFVIDASDGDAFDGTLWSLGVLAPHRRDLAPLDLRFDFFGRSPSGLRVPGNIRVFRGGDPEPQVKLGVDVNKDGSLVFEVDSPLAAGTFTRPADGAGGTAPGR